MTFPLVVEVTTPTNVQSFISEHADEIKRGIQDYGAIILRGFRQAEEQTLSNILLRLSGGERQRLTIARVLLKDAPILILDEATASLDSHAEAATQEALRTLMSGRTVIAIAHRLSTLTDMDRLLVIDAGRIIEEGNHDDLLLQGGAYAAFWNRQQRASGATDGSMELSAEVI